MDFQYQLTFANIPFVADMARVIRLHHDTPEQEEAKQRSPKRFQVEADLVDEIQKIIPLHYLQDFALPGEFPGRNLNALARQFQATTLPSPDVHLYDWYYPTGASRWSVFRGLATSSMAQAMLAATGGSTPQTFVMFANPLSPDNPNYQSQSYMISSPMYMLPPRPLGELGGSFDGLYLITLVDERFYWQFNPTSVNVNSNSTWASIVQQLAESLNVTINFSTFPSVYTSHPCIDSQFWTNQESAAVILDALAYNLGTVVVRSLDGSYTLQTPLSSQEIISDNRGPAQSVVRTAGGDIFATGNLLPVGDLTQSKNSVLPSAVNITFPMFDIANDPVPHFINTRYASRSSAWYEESYGSVYTIPVSIAQGGPNVAGLTGVPNVTHCIHSTAKAFFNGEDTINGQPLNYSGLQQLATQLTQDYYNQQIASALDEVYPGTFAWTPEGIHDIIWTYSCRSRQAVTRVMRSEWNQIIKEMQHSTPSDGASLPIIVTGAGTSVAQTWVDTYSGDISTILIGSIPQNKSMGQSEAVSFPLADPSYLPTQNRWVALIDQEYFLLDGTSGGNTVTVANRALYGSTAAAHQYGASVVYQTPDASYGVNYVNLDKGQFSYPDTWTSGGIQGVTIVPQMQTVQVLSSESETINGIDYYSGQINLWDTTQDQEDSFDGLEYVWVSDINGNTLTSGTLYEGKYVGVSQITKGTTAPLYTVDNGASTPTPDLQNWQDSYEPENDIIPTLKGSLSNTDTNATISTGQYLPTQNRWLAQIEDELILFEGTSGGTAVDIVARGLYGTTAAVHPFGAQVTYQTPDTISGVLQVTFEKGQWIYPNEYNGNIYGLNVVPQMQTVQVLSSESETINGIDYYSGQINLWDTTLEQEDPFNGLEYIWVSDINGNTLTSGTLYEGKYVGVSQLIPAGSIGSIETGTPAPLYTVDTGESPPAARFSGAKYVNVQTTSLQNTGTVVTWQQVEYDTDNYTITGDGSTFLLPFLTGYYLLGFSLTVASTMPGNQYFLGQIQGDGQSYQVDGGISQIIDGATLTSMTLNFNEVFSFGTITPSIQVVVAPSGGGQFTANACSFWIQYLGS